MSIILCTVMSIEHHYVSIIKQLLTSLVTLGFTGRKWLSKQWLFRMMFKRVTDSDGDLLVIDVVIGRLGSDSCVV